jgi:HTH-type transcriptional regulator, sugar sensing transcriptional regulator
MIVKEEFLSRLRKIFDLNLYEVKIWTALLSRGVSTAGELSNISDVPRSRTYDILETLEKKGFIIMKLGKPIKFVALKPEEVVERVKKNLVRDASEKSKRLERLKGEDILSELSSLFTQGVKFVEPSDLSGSLKGRQNVYNHLDMMIREAEKTITVVTTTQGLNRKLEALMPGLDKARRRGVKIRIASPINDSNRKIAKELSKVAEVRSIPTKLRARFAIIDSNQLLFMVLDDDVVHPNYDVAVWLSTDFFAVAMEQMFEIAWKSFKKV